MANCRRDLAKEQRWREVLARQVASGLSGRAFCRREGLSEASFYAWRRTLAGRDGESLPQLPAAQRPAFVPAMVTGEPRPGKSILLELAGGRVLRLPDSMAAAWLAELVHALEVGR